MYAELRVVWDELTSTGGPFEVVEVEVRGQQARTYRKQPASLRELWVSSAVHGDKDYLVYGDERISYAEAHQQVARIANWLKAIGVVPGDRVAVAMRNYPEWLLAYWACVSSGVAVVGMNAWWVGPEIAYAIQDADPAVVIADQERLERLDAVRGQLGERVFVGVRCSEDDWVVPWTDLTSTELADTLPDADVHPDDDACILYTSGTTGRPKGAQLTHRSCLTNLMSLAFANTVQTKAASAARGEDESAHAPPVSPAALVITPLFHVTANNCVAHPMTFLGGKLVHTYKWDPGEVLRLIEAERITSMTGVPTMSRELLAHPDFSKRDTSSLLTMGGGGAQLQPDLVHRIDREVGTARPTTGYGMTETSGIITAIAADFFVDKPDSAGPVMPCFEAACFDDAGQEVAAGEIGELWVKGAQVVKGYVNQPEATAEAITDGWLHTGDIARMDDDGFVYIVDRKKDMVLRGGENVYCAEVEAVLFEHQAVAECAVFGVADERLGEEVGAAVHPLTPVSPQELRDFMASRLAKHKIPRYLWVVENQLPRNATGKFVKNQLRDSLDIRDAS
ncbi:MAG: class I adenylate-forming enzyme family protein [Acidimicrobiales bacterium]